MFKNIRAYKSFPEILVKNLRRFLTGKGDERNKRIQMGTGNVFHFLADMRHI
jgi:hypothetical protein